MEENQELEMKPKLEDIYEPETAFEDNDYMKCEIKDEAKVKMVVYFVRH